MAIAILPGPRLKCVCAFLSRSLVAGSPHVSLGHRRRSRQAVERDHVPLKVCHGCPFGLVAGDVARRRITVRATTQAASAHIALSSRQPNSNTACELRSICWRISQCTIVRFGMSPMGHSRRSGRSGLMSALTPKAAKLASYENGREVPQTDISRITPPLTYLSVWGVRERW